MSKTSIAQAIFQLARCEQTYSYISKKIKHLRPPQAQDISLCRYSSSLHVIFAVTFIKYLFPLFYLIHVIFLSDPEKIFVSFSLQTFSTIFSVFFRL